MSRFADIKRIKLLSFAGIQTQFRMKSMLIAANHYC